MKQCLLNKISMKKFIVDSDVHSNSIRRMFVIFLSMIMYVSTRKIRIFT